MLYDVFISHASEDKNDFVRPLAHKLKENHLEVWYDEFSLKIGDSLRRSIDNGLSKCRYGIVVLSRNFFRKEWPQWELDGLVSRQNNSKSNLILPIWFDITKEEIIKYSPPLADKIAIIADRGIEYVVTELLKTIKSEGSSLLIARDRLIEFGIEPPVVTDDWWHDIIEYSGSNSVEDTFQSPMGWGRWGFPIPAKGNSPKERGERIAWAAMQMVWQNNSEKQLITQITHPDKVLEFVNSQAGLKETCFNFPHYLAAYAPQLTIRGFGGEFEAIFEDWYEKSLTEQEKQLSASNVTGTGLTVNKEVPACDESLALRHPTFGNYSPAIIACNYVQGELMGPPVKVFETIDYVVFFLSDKSNWMPKNVKDFLIKGLKEWAVWVWGKHDNCYNNSIDYPTDALLDAMFQAETPKDFKFTEAIMKDIRARFEYSISLLNINEPTEKIVEEFLKNGFIEAWIKKRNRRRKKK